MTNPKKPRVMLADDEDHSRLYMKAIIQSMNCDIAAEARNGKEAIELFRKTKPHLLLLDINMPLMTGDEVLSTILTEFPNAFIIMLTSVSDMASIESCLTLGAANYIRKDTSVNDIKAIITDTWRSFVQNRLKGKTNSTR